MKVIKVAGSKNELDEWDLKRVEERVNPDLFVYNYENFGYEGSGWAAWYKNGEFGYTYLGHCSCNGPTDDLNSIYYTLSQLERIAEKEYKDYALPVIEALKNEKLVQ